jgi:hypothetical protein
VSLVIARARFLSQNPAAALYADFGDFALWRLVVERAHFVGGFARAIWIEDGFLVNPPLAAEMAEAVPGILDHMNADHADTVAHYAAAFLPADDQCEGAWKMVSLDSDGFHMAHSEAARSYVVLFDHPLKTVEDCRPTLVALAKKARQVVTASQGPFGARRAVLRRNIRRTWTLGLNKRLPHRARPYIFALGVLARPQRVPRQGALRPAIPSPGCLGWRPLSASSP